MKENNDPLPTLMEIASEKLSKAYDAGFVAALKQIIVIIEKKQVLNVSKETFNEMTQIKRELVSLAQLIEKYPIKNVTTK